MLFFFYGYGDHRDLHSFPTRRSSDLQTSSGVTLDLVGETDRDPGYAARVRHALQAPDLAGRVRVHGHVSSDRLGELYGGRSEEHTSELQSLRHLVCRLLLEKKKNNKV